MQALPPKVTTPLDHSLFLKKVLTLSVLVPNSHIHPFQKRFGKWLLTAPKFKPCQVLANDPLRKRMILKDLKSEPEADIKLRAHVESYNQEKKEEMDWIVVENDHAIELTYENYNMSDALRVLLPNVPDNEIPSGFECIGDIAHLNILNEECIKKKYQIGQVVLDKNSTVRTVVRKVGQIESQFRFYNLECIAGEKDNYETV